MKKSLICIIQLFVLISIHNNKLLSQKHELYIEFSIEKTEYVKDEPVIINYKITNSGSGNEIIPYNCDVLYDVFESLNMQNEGGEKFKYIGIIADCIGGKLVLNPGQYITTEKNDFFRFGMNLYTGYGNLPEGIYTISYKKFMYTDIKALSNNITFSINKPGVKEGFNKLFEIFSMPDSSAKFESLRKYIYEYPESGYLNIAFGEYLRLRGYRTISIQEFIKDFNYFINYKHDCWSIYYYLKYCSDAINEVKGEDEMISYLAKIMKKYPGSKAGAAAYDLLKKMIPNEIYLKGLKN